VNGESAAGAYIGTVGGQGAFARAAITSESGRSIIALSSTTPDRTISRIVPHLSGCTTSVARSDADLIVTEHGIADLRGMSLRERSSRLVGIAHPDHRDALRAGVS
jgi:acyl-CoA hydrolase